VFESHVTVDFYFNFGQQKNFIIKKKKYIKKISKEGKRN
jgi:hypothetical protein